ncbi:hypothetical protein DL768_010408 [Monosporascus sp. mg162]|nr:hypothetical protein DL768_010408 [Monosporascus sp. mg162]
MELLDLLVMRFQKLSAQDQVIILLMTLAALAVALYTMRAGVWHGPERLKDPIPFISNTYQYMTNQAEFLVRVAQAMKTNTLVKFYLGPRAVYLVCGPQNMQKFFGSSRKIGNEDLFLRTVMPKLYGMPKHELDRFAADKTGRSKIPVLGTGYSGPRLWFTEHHIHNEYMSRSRYLNCLNQHYYRVFAKTLDKKQAIGTWSIVSLTDLCRNEMVQCAIETFVGTRIFELNPGFTDMFWQFDSVVFALALGLPTWMNPRPTKIRNRWNKMIQIYLDTGLGMFDWNGPAAEADWEPIFGARVCRELVKWLRESSFSMETVAGFLGTFLWAQNSNSIPIAIWTLVYLVRDPALYQEVRQEVHEAETTDPSTGQRTIDVGKLMVAPVLQAVFSETLRLHMSFNVLREVKDSVTMNGHVLHTGALLQAPMQVAHYDESWAADGHPVDEFWPGRHIKYVEGTDEAGNISRQKTFSLGGRPSSYFPFGGGVSICPGRQFAKHEMFTTLALIVSKFDLEFVKWTKLDGSPSDRPGANDESYAGGGAMPPDRDMKVRWRRIW